MENIWQSLQTSRQGPLGGRGSTLLLIVLLTLQSWYCRTGAGERDAGMFVASDFCFLSALSPEQTQTLSVPLLHCAALKRRKEPRDKQPDSVRVCWEVKSKGVISV